MISLLLVLLTISCTFQAEETTFLTTNAGAPIDNIRSSETVGPRGPTLLQDFWLLENLQIHNRERIPERNVHARGATAKGEFVVTANLSDLSIADFVQTNGEKTPVAIRFSTVIHGIHSPEFLRDPRGFAIKFYTQEGNYDVVGNNWPIFFIRDGMRFPEMVRAFKPNPKTGVQEWWRILDFFASYPESIHALTWLLDDIGIPLTYRYMHGWGIHTYKFINKSGVETYFRWFFESTLGEKGQLDEDAVRQPFSFHTTDLINAINNGEFPKYNVYVQIMDPNRPPSSFDPLDPTKEWPTSQYPYRKVGELTLNQNVESFFTENEQIAFAPSRMVPGVAPSDDKLLQARLFAYADTQRYRLGVNNQMLPINAPKCPFKDNHVDGFMHFRTGSRASREINYFPSTIDKTTTEAQAYPHESANLQGKKERTFAPVYDDYIQAGNRWRSFDSARQQRFADRVALTLSGEKVPAALRETWLGYWTQVDPKLAEMIRNSLLTLIQSNQEIKRSREEHEAFLRLSNLRENFIRTSGYP